MSMLYFLACILLLTVILSIPMGKVIMWNLLKWAVPLLLIVVGGFLVFETKGNFDSADAQLKWIGIALLWSGLIPLVFYIHLNEKKEKAKQGRILTAHINQFMADKRYPYASLLVEDMTKLIKSGAAKTLPNAYDLALRNLGWRLHTAYQDNKEMDQNYYQKLVKEETAKLINSGDATNEDMAFSMLIRMFALQALKDKANEAT